jgi:hypothetical protein
MAILKLVCAWCGHVIRGGDPGSDTSHGICPKCFVKWQQPKEAA